VNVVTDSSASKGFAWLLLAATIAVPLVHIFHPETSGESLEDVVRSLAQHASADRIVHGTVAVLVLAMFLPYVQLAYVVGFDLAAVRSAIAVGALATVAMFGIPLVDGVILPSVAERYAEPDSAAQIEGFRSILRLTAVGVIPTLAMAAAVGFATSTLCWCVAYRETVGGRRVLPALGAVLAAASLIGVSVTRSPMVLELCLLAWNLVVAGYWLTGKLVRRTA
jgi:hypothetical protein